MSKIINQINNVIEEYVTEINKEFNIPRESLLGLWKNKSTNSPGSQQVILKN